LSDADPPAQLLLYDGVCALCNWAVRLVLRFDRRRTMEFAPLGGPAARRVLAAHPELATVDSIVLIEGDHASVRSTAVLQVLRYLGGGWRVFLVGYLIPREIRDSLYDVVAHWRKRIFGQYDACPLPPAEHRSRFRD
jgi:predicted DCC family thiol-disulfide oxidoreductase YuxK